MPALRLLVLALLAGGSLYAAPIRPACGSCNQVHLEGAVVRVEVEKSRGRLQRVTAYVTDAAQLTGVPLRLQCDETLSRRCARVEKFFACRNTVTFVSYHPLRPEWTIETTRCRNPRALGKWIVADGFLYNGHNVTFTVAVELREGQPH